MAKVSRESDQFVVRLPPGLRDRIRDHARRSGRSMNGEIVEALEASFPEVELRQIPLGDVLALWRAYLTASGQSEETGLGDKGIETLWQICTRQAAEVPDDVQEAVRATYIDLGYQLPGGNA